MINKRFTNITNYDIRNQTFHFNNRAVNFYLDFSFLCRPIWWNATVSPFPLVLILFGVMALTRIPPLTTPLLAGIIHMVRKVTHTVYSYGSLMLAIIVTVILTLTQTRELEQRQSLVYWSGISRGKKCHKYFWGMAYTNPICNPKA